MSHLKRAFKEEHLPMYVGKCQQDWTLCKLFVNHMY
jgi:hypothetical protein